METAQASAGGSHMAASHAGRTASVTVHRTAIAWPMQKQCTSVMLLPVSILSLSSLRPMMATEGLLFPVPDRRAPSSESASLTPLPALSPLLSSSFLSDAAICSVPELRSGGGMMTTFMLSCREVLRPTPPAIIAHQVTNFCMQMCWFITNSLIISLCASSLKQECSPHCTAQTFKQTNKL